MQHRCVMERGDLVDPRMRRFFEQELEWYRGQRKQAENALRRYEEGKMTFHVNHVDVTEEQKARLRRMIGDFNRTIAEIETGLAGDDA